MLSRAAFGTPPVKKQHLPAKATGQVAAHHGTELGVLGEQQRPLADLKHLGQDLLQPFELSGARPYSVIIELDPFTEHMWEKAEIALSEQALPSAKLLAGEVPPELEEIFAAAGAPLFPRTADELYQECSCPDWEVPCKHLAATFYLLAEAFDEDPFLILRWRGRDREALLSRLRQLRDGESDDQLESSSVAPPVIGAALALAGLRDSKPAEELDRFWLPPPPLPARSAVLEVEPDLVLRQSPVPAGMLGGEELISRLRRAYEGFAIPEEQG